MIHLERGGGNGKFRVTLASERDRVGIYNKSVQVYLDQLVLPSNVAIGSPDFFNLWIGPPPTGQKSICRDGRKSYRGKEADDLWKRKVKEGVANGSQDWVGFPVVFYPHKEGFGYLEGMTHAAFVLVYARNVIGTSVSATYYESFDDNAVFKINIMKGAFRQNLSRIIGRNVNIEKKTHVWKSPVSKGCNAVVAYWMTKLAQGFPTASGEHLPNPKSDGCVTGTKSRLIDINKLLLVSK